MSVKLCKDCKYATGAKYCLHPEVALENFDFYTGIIHTIYATCQQARMIGRCEVDGKFWTPYEVGFGENI